MPVNIIPRAGFDRLTIYRGSLDRKVEGLRVWLTWFGLSIEITCFREEATR